MTDFLVIGGGIAGLSAGAALSKLGKVTLLEGEDTLGYHSSGRSAALFEPTYGSASTVALNRASADFFHTTENLLSPRGLMMVGLDGEREAFEAGLKQMSMHAIGTDEACDLIPVLNLEAVTMAGYHAEAWDIDTDLLMQTFAGKIRKSGGKVLTDRKVSAVTRVKDGWQVVAAGESFYTRIVVNAAGAWADHVAVMAGITPIGIQPFRRSIARVSAPTDYDVSRWPTLFGPGETWYMKPDAGCLLVSPADETPVDPHDAWAEELTLAEGIALYEERVSVPVTRMVANWAGLRSFAPDRNLVIGPDTRDDTFLWMAAQGGYGFQTSPAASRLLADLAGGAVSELDDESLSNLSPDRFE